MLERRFLEKTERQPNGCLLWLAGKDPDGYGIYSANGRPVRAHKWAYEQVHGPVPLGMVLDHYVCDSPSCVEEQHLRPVTNRENLLRGDTVNAKNLAKRECLNGHLFDERNTYVSKAGKRMCRTCIRNRQRVRAARRKVT